MNSKPVLLGTRLQSAHRAQRSTLVELQASNVDDTQAGNMEVQLTFHSNAGTAVVRSRAEIVYVDMYHIIFCHVLGLQGYLKMLC